MENDKLTCICCYKEGKAEEFETDEFGTVACKDCLSKGFVEKCAECDGFFLDGEMHDVPGLHVRVCPDCWNGRYGEPEEENTSSSSCADEKGCAGCPGEEGGCGEHPAECGRWDQNGKKVW